MAASEGSVAELQRGLARARHAIMQEGEEVDRAMTARAGAQQGGRGGTRQGGRGYGRRLGRGSAEQQEVLERAEAEARTEGGVRRGV